MTTTSLVRARPPAELLLELLVALAGLGVRTLESAGALLRLPAPRPSRPVPVLPRPAVRLVAAGPAVIAAQRRVPPVLGGPGSPRTRRRLTARDLVLPAVLLAEFGVGVLIGVLT